MVALLLVMLVMQEAAPTSCVKSGVRPQIHAGAGDGGVRLMSLVKCGARLPSAPLPMSAYDSSCDTGR